MKRSRLMLAGLGIAGLVLAGFAMAGAQETPGTTAPPDKQEKPSPEKRFRDPGEFPGRFGHGFKSGRGAIHGEFTTRGAEGGFRTVATQTGEVTSVSKSSMTLKSEDGFSRSYDVDENTLVNAGRDGIESVKTGDQARVMATVEGGKARAVQMFDTTNVERLRQRWR